MYLMKLKFNKHRIMSFDDSILILGSFGLDNFGDDKLLEAYVNYLKNRGYNNFNINYSKIVPKVTTDVNINFFLTKNLFRLIQYIIKSKMIIIGGGTSIKLLSKSTNRNSYSTIFPLAIVSLFIKLLRKRYIISCIGIGNISTRFSKILTKVILYSATDVSLRDKRSYSFAIKMLHSKNTLPKFTGDGVFLDECKFKYTKNTGPKATINFVSDLPDNANFDAYKVFIKFVIKSENSLRFVSFHEDNDIHSDSYYFDQIIKQYNKTYKKVSALQFFSIIPYSVDDAYIFSRYHAMIYAIRSGIIFFGVAYDIKCRELLEELKYPYWIDINYMNKAEDNYFKYKNRDKSKDLYLKSKFESWSKNCANRVRRWSDETIPDRTH